MFDGVAQLVTTRRRYRCSECGWIGWKHRLRRRSHQSGRKGFGILPSAIVAVFIASVLVLGAGLLMEGCDDAAPPAAEIGGA